MKRYISQQELISMIGVSRQTLTNWRNGYTVSRDDKHWQYPPILNDSEWHVDRKGNVWYSAQALNKILKRMKERQ